MASSNDPSAGFTVPADPFNQIITMLLPNGQPFNISVDDLSQFHFYGTLSATIQGTEIGTSIVMLVAILVLTRPDKLTGTIFMLNVAALFLNFVRAILMAVYTSGPWQNVYAFFAGDFGRVPPNAYATSIATPVIKSLELIAIELSLTLQVNVVLVTMRRTHRLAIVVWTSLIALLAVGFQVAVMVTNAQAIMTIAPGPPQWLQMAQNVTITISVCFSFVVFTLKLGYALIKRRQMKLPQFGPMKIIFIMGLNTMVIPGKYSIISQILRV
jgi:pheromone alpha factor receptor